MTFGDPVDYATMPEDKRLKYVYANLYIWMAGEALGSGDPSVPFPFDPHSGLEALAHSAGGAFERHILSYRHRTCETTADKTLRNLGEVYLHTVFLAVLEMVSDDRAEISMCGGWPCIRLTDPSEIAVEGAKDLWGDEAFAVIERARDRVEALRTMAYQDYLQTPEWAAKRKRKIAEAQGRCQLCNDASLSLHVHHRTYVDRGNERMFDLIALCPTCHEQFHASGRKVGR